jgi:NAD-dependent SIR2 family protein deacetylase
MRKTHYERLSKSEAAETTKLEPGEFKEMLSQGNVLIYTGAGTSVAAGLPSGNFLRRGLGVEMNKDIDSFTELLALSNSTFYTNLLGLRDKFHGDPTPAHTALERIRALNEDRILLATENLDKLHQKAGSHVIPFEKISEIPDELLENTDYFVTVGLQQACTDLPQRYKRVNPHGKVIAINTNPPPYQYSADYYVEGDAQKILVDVAQRFENPPT